MIGSAISRILLAAAERMNVSVGPADAAGAKPLPPLRTPPLTVVIRRLERSGNSTPVRALVRVLIYSTSISELGDTHVSVALVESAVLTVALKNWTIDPESH